MASEPEELIVSAYSKNVSPGYLYNLSTKEYSPGDTKHAINIEQCKPEYEITHQGSMIPQELKSRTMSSLSKPSWRMLTHKT
ncbi:hypothetical protein O3P69_001448 [Scylla paramamosain]|uniref:Uncharacterized protein n=1 Tax=Scylla paramamosain TaxID=85552 RepID=A0AAW0V045_SCYPA